MPDCSCWIVCQIGAREHYAVARVLHADGALDRLITDAWVPPGHPPAALGMGLRERFHADLASARVSASTFGVMMLEALSRLRGERGWRRIAARNAWFQRMALSRLSRVLDDGVPRTLFAYSYAAGDLFRFARTRSWHTVLGQIDGGPAEERIVAGLCTKRPDQAGGWEPAPAGYWKSWREECALADRIVVNSRWSQRALEEEGVRPEKVRVVPLAYEAPKEAAGFRRRFPARFTKERPLRVLFLGQINLRKGAGPLLDAVRLLAREPVEFWFVGPRQISVPPDLERASNVKWLGAVSRGATAQFYRDADVFILPTFSDGFAITQLEAQAWKLPIIASRFCGEVVQDGHNGIVLEDVTAEMIAETIRRCRQKPALLTGFAPNVVGPSEFGLANLGASLQRLFRLSDA